jgi:hypothetical protein
MVLGGVSGFLCPEDMRAGGGERVHDQFDVTLEDSDLLHEVELTTNLIIAASESDGALSVAQIDAILGVEPDSAAADGDVPLPAE